MIPETSGFFGRLEDRNAAEQEMFFHLQLHSLTKGPHSIKAKLDEYNAHFAQLNKQDKNEDIKIKVSFYTACLRNFAPDKNYFIRHKLSTKLLTFDQKFNFSPKFQFFSKISIFL